MKYVHNTKITFHYGNAFDEKGIEAEPFATFTHAGMVERALVDKLAHIVRAHVNKHYKDFCNIKVSVEDWDV